MKFLTQYPKKRFTDRRAWLGTAVLTFLLSTTVLCAAETNEFSEARTAFGKKNAVTYKLAPIEPSEMTKSEAGPGADLGTASVTALGVASVTEPETTTDKIGFYATLYAMLFGKDRSILETQAGMTNLLEGESDFYWGGFRVWSSKPEFKDGSFQISAGLPSVTMRAPLIGVPVGPVTLQLDAGIAAEAAVTGKLTPLISTPVQDTEVVAELNPQAFAVGFVEGYAKWVAIRAGVGGELELVSADASVSGKMSFRKFKPVFAYSGYIGLLAGKIYGFVDYFNIFRWKWKRALQPVFAEWPGKCYAFDSKTGGDPCVDFK